MRTRFDSYPLLDKQLECIVRASTVAQLKDRILNEMPTCNEDAYEMLIQSHDQRETILKVLAWLHCSAVPIGMYALCEALRVREPGYYTFPEGVDYKPTDIQKWCGQLIYWDETLDLVKINDRGCHEYLDSRCSTDMKRVGRVHLPLICLHRLLFEDAKGFPPRDQNADHSQPVGLIDHALKYWSTYVLEVNEDPETRGLVAQVLLYNSRAKCTLSSPLVRGLWEDETLAGAVHLDPMQESQKALHILIRYGLIQTAHAVLHCQTAAADLGLTWKEVTMLGDINSRDSWQQTLLHCAAASGCGTDFISDLLAGGAKLDANQTRADLFINTRNVHGFTALHCAAYTGKHSSH